MLKDLVPENFPGTLDLVKDPHNEGAVVINPAYRKYSTPSNSEFYYFVTRMPSSMNPKN